MNLDYTYCLSEECIHRRVCKRNLENYKDEYVKELYTESRFIDEINEGDCTNNFEFLDRFRNSDGSELK